MSTIKKTSTLIKLSLNSKFNTEKFINNVILGLTSNNIIEFDNSSWGHAIKEFVSDVEVYTIIYIMHAAGIENVKSDSFLMFMDLIIMGDGDCPCCGDYMETVDSEFDVMELEYDSEPLENIKNKTEKCYNCGYTVTI